MGTQQRFGELNFAYFLPLYFMRHQPPNGLRYRLVGGMRQRYFAGANSKPRKVPENARTPTSRVHAVLGAVLILGFA